MAPSLYVPVAKNAIEAPFTIAVLDGLIPIDTSWVVGTVIVAVPQIDPSQALTVAVPAPTPYALPLFVESLVTATMEVLDELQEAEASA